MDCDRYMQLLSARLDGALTEEEERELEGHLSRCPAVRAGGQMLLQLPRLLPGQIAVQAEGKQLQIFVTVHGRHPLLCFFSTV